jgi:hypothetical protein
MRLYHLLAGLCCAAVVSTAAYAVMDQTVPDPEPAVYRGVVYKAQSFGKVHGRAQDGGYVQAFDSVSGVRLWEKKVYDTKDLQEPFSDPHDVFIERLEVKDNVLYVIAQGEYIFAFPLFSPDKKLDAKLDTEIVVKGDAMNFVDCAGVRDGEYVYLMDGMIRWPVGFEGNTVTVKGTLIRKPLTAAFDARSAFRADVDAFAYMLTRADWEDNVMPKKDKYEINKDLDPKFRDVVRGREEQ